METLFVYGLEKENEHFWMYVSLSVYMQNLFLCLCLFGCQSYVPCYVCVTIYMYSLCIKHIPENFFFLYFFIVVFFFNILSFLFVPYFESITQELTIKLFQASYNSTKFFKTKQKYT